MKAVEAEDLVSPLPTVTSILHLMTNHDFNTFKGILIMLRAPRGVA